MNSSDRQALARDTKAATALEFAVVASVLMVVLLGSWEIALKMWMQGTLQSVAAQTARCSAINSAACSNPRQYAVTLATAWLGSSVITTANVNVAVVTVTNTTVGTTPACGTEIGTFEVVSINASLWVPPVLRPLTGTVRTLKACYPI